MKLANMSQKLRISSDMVAYWIVQMIKSARVPRTQALLAGSANHQRHGETVVTLGTNSLNRGRRKPRLGCHQVEETPHALNARIGTVRSDHIAVAHHIVTDDERARTRKAVRTNINIPGCWAYPRQ